ncbi:MAG: fasciclin domain-containing protein [Sphingomicrobium sp.]
MQKSALVFGLAVSRATLSACDGKGEGNPPNGNEVGSSKDGASSKTIAEGISKDSRFLAAAKSVGLDQTLNGKDSYTVLVPDDAAFAKLPAATTDSWSKPEARGQLTGVLTYHILPGVVLAEDIGKAIDNSNGKAMLATVGGGTLTATKEGGKIVLADGAGGKATLGQADEKYSNGVVHHIDAVLSPAKR